MDLPRELCPRLHHTHAALPGEMPRAGSWDPFLGQEEASQEDRPLFDMAVLAQPWCLPGSSERDLPGPWEDKDRVGREAQTQI